MTDDDDKLVDMIHEAADHEPSKPQPVDSQSTHIPDKVLRDKIFGLVQHINKYTPERGELYTELILTLIKADRNRLIEALEGEKIEDGDYGLTERAAHHNETLDKAIQIVRASHDTTT